MGFNIRIANATVVQTENGYLSFKVPRIDRDDDVPFSLGIWGSNEIIPTYGFWQDFCVDLGITDLFYYELESKGLGCHQYPGVLAITEEVITKLKTALEDYQKRYPDIEIKDELTTDLTRTYLHGLRWLIYWSERAFKSGPLPGISLS